MDARHDEHYLRDVTLLGDSRQMVAHRPIYTQNRIKLVDIGTRITSALFEKLVRHKLLPVIDECVTVENQVTVDSLVEEAQRLVAAQPFLTHLAAMAGGTDRLLAPLRQVVLEPPLALKLTVMQERRAHLFEHSLEVATIALYLGQVGLFLDSASLRQLAAAALFHDIGEMHIDPAMLDPAHEVTDDERRHIYAHPVTAFLILKEYPAYASHVATAVLQHHERVDGNGYPRGITGAESTPLGRILALVEVVASMLRKLPARGELSRVGIAIKLSSHKYDSTLVSCMSAAFRQFGHGSTEANTEPLFLARIEKLGSLIGSWQAVYEALAERYNSGPLAQSVNDRVADLERALFDAGCHPDQLALAYRSTRDDAGAFAEMAELADEGIWQFRNIVHETRRRWDALKGGETESQSVLRWLDSCDTVLEARPEKIA